MIISILNMLNIAIACPSDLRMEKYLKAYLRNLDINIKQRLNLNMTFLEISDIETYNLFIDRETNLKNTSDLVMIDNIIHNCYNINDNNKCINIIIDSIIKE